MIIGFGHQREVGKDTAAMIMSTEVKLAKPSLEVLSIGFADPLYKICNELYGWAGMQDKRYYDANKETKDIILNHIGQSPRDLLIATGLKIREVWSDTWLQYALNRKSDLTFISDVRFSNEAQAIHDSGGILVKIKRPGLPKITDPDDPDNRLIDWANWDFVIENDGTKKEFAEKCREVLKCIER